MKILSWVIISLELGCSKISNYRDFYSCIWNYTMHRQWWKWDLNMKTDKKVVSSTGSIFELKKKCSKSIFRMCAFSQKYKKWINLSLPLFFNELILRRKTFKFGRKLFYSYLSNQVFRLQTISCNWHSYNSFWTLLTPLY